MLKRIWENMIIDINELLQMEAKRKEINDIPIEDIQWQDGEKMIPISPELLNEWKFIGLSNINLITTGYYKNGELNNES